MWKTAYWRHTSAEERERDRDGWSDKGDRAVARRASEGPFPGMCPDLDSRDFFFSLPSYSSNKNRRDPLPTANVNVKPVYMYLPRCGHDDMRWECAHAAHNMSLMIKNALGALIVSEEWRWWWWWSDTSVDYSTGHLQRQYSIVVLSLPDLPTLHYLVCLGRGGEMDEMDVHAGGDLVCSSSLS
jgi:hypothetical protein